MHIYTNLASFHKKKADPKDTLDYKTENIQSLIELPYLYCHALDYIGIRNTLGNLNYIKERFKLGLYSIQLLLRDYQDLILFFQELQNNKSKEFFNKYKIEKSTFSNVLFFNIYSI